MEGEMKMDSQNSVAKLLSFTRIGIYILGLIGSLALARVYGGYGFQVGIFFAGLVSAFITGTIFIGLAEIISILDENRGYLKSIVNKNDIDLDELPDL